MRVPETNIGELREQGFTIVPGFLDPVELRAAQDALWLHYPRPEEYFADPGAHADYAGSQFAGLRSGPFKSWDLNRLTFHPDLVDLASRFLGSDDLHLYKTELWAKYSGATDYDQDPHRDFKNHSLVVPKRADPGRQMTSFILLSDVTDEDGPTKVVPRQHGDAVPYWPNRIERGPLDDVEIAVTGPAGTLFTYRTDVLHRGSQMTGVGRARFAVLADYKVWGDRWGGRMAWPHYAPSPHWVELMERASPRERELFGFPSPGDPYWDEQTVADVGVRYPHMDMSPYRTP